MNKKIIIAGALLPLVFALTACDAGVEKEARTIEQSDISDAPTATETETQEVVSDSVFSEALAATSAPYDFAGEEEVFGLYTIGVPEGWTVLPADNATMAEYAVLYGNVGVAFVSSDESVLTAPELGDNSFLVFTDMTDIAGAENVEVTLLGFAEMPGTTMVESESLGTVAVYPMVQGDMSMLAAFWVNEGRLYSVSIATGNEAEFDKFYSILDTVGTV